MNALVSVSNWYMVIFVAYTSIFCWGYVFYQVVSIGKWTTLNGRIVPWSSRVGEGGVLCIHNSSPIAKKHNVSKIFQIFSPNQQCKVWLSSPRSWAKFNLSIVIITKVSLLGYAVYFLAGAVCISWKINGIVKWAISANNRDRKYNLAQLTEQWMLNTPVLLWWRYLKYLWKRMIFFHGMAPFNWRIMLVSFPRMQTSQSWSFGTEIYISMFVSHSSPLQCFIQGFFIHHTIRQIWSTFWIPTSK